MAKLRKRIRKEILRCVRDGIRRNVDGIFAESQLECPVDKGFLKGSGIVKNTKYGARIIYRAKYSSVLHSGAPRKPVEGDHAYEIKRHKRRFPYKVKKTGQNWTWVSAHKKHYHNMRIVPLNKEAGIWRVTRIQGRVKENPFLLRAMQKELPNIKHDIGFFLERLGNVKVS